MATQQNAEPVQLDASAVLKVIEEGYPEVVRYAMWRVRAEMAEEEIARLKAEAAPEANAE